MPYGSQDFLELSEDGAAIEEENLTFFADKDPGEIDKPSPDLSCEPDGVLVITPDCYSILQPIFDAVKFKIYEGVLDADECIVYCCMTEVIGFDFERSNFETFSDGAIDRIFDLRLVDGFITNYDIFRLADDWGPRFELIVSDKFVELCKRHNLKGLGFLPT